LAYPSIQLFVERTTTARRDVELSERSLLTIGEICRRLDGIPLAIELAAARAADLSIDDVAARLDDRLRLLVGGTRTAPDRQQTLRATVDWSYHLLTPPERRLLDSLSVFAGGWTLAAAEDICVANHVQSRAIADVLGMLVSKSLVERSDGEDGHTRYWLLQTVRDYAAERLCNGGAEETIRSRHAGHFLQLAEAAAPQLVGPSIVTWLQLLDREHDNLRSALRWFSGRGDIEHALQLGAALGRFWFSGGHVAEGRARLAELLDLSDDGSSWTRGRALEAAGALAILQADWDAARRYLEQGLALSRSVGDSEGIAWALFNLGFISRLAGDYAVAGRVLGEGLVVSRAGGHLPHEAFILFHLGFMARDEGRDEEARELLEHSLAVAERAGFARVIGFDHESLGVLDLQAGYLSTARTHFETARDIWRATDEWRGLSFSLGYLGRLAVSTEQLTEARQSLAEALKYATDLADRRVTLLALEAIVEFAAATTDRLRALRLAGAVLALRTSAHMPMSAPDAAAFKRRLRPVRASTGRLAAEHTLRHGASLSLDEAVAEARAAIEGASTADARAIGLLTPRERSVAELVARGASNRHVAQMLHISERTVARHLENIFAKLGLNTRTQVSLWIVEHGLSTRESA
jgi:predicted ATPase/DNA-binding NarL/FixJ family response regulator